MSYKTAHGTQETQNHTIHWANKRINEEDGRTLILVIRLMFEHATDRAAWRKMYAQLFWKIDDGADQAGGSGIMGSIMQKESLLPAVSSSGHDRINKSLNEQKGSEEAAAHASYAAQKVMRLGLGLTVFLGELFRRQAIAEFARYELGKDLNVSSRIQFMFQGVVELRDRKWIRRKYCCYSYDDRYGSRGHPTAKRARPISIGSRHALMPGMRLTQHPACTQVPQVPDSAPFAVTLAKGRVAEPFIFICISKS
ncbi:hypothetical protein F4604DRAFT_1679758 [Suillus subluteus]|nr:hypothetical protein F4604DRAFT_1679758 [Suillus subluteus]